MKFKSLLTFSAASLLTSGAASAVTFNLQFFVGEVFGTSSASQGLIVVDTLGNGFTGFDSLANQNFSLGQSLAGSDDIIIAAGNFTDFNPGTSAFFQAGLAANTDAPPWEGTGVGLGQPIGMYWFPDGTSNPGSEVGFFRDANNRDAVIGTDSGWFTPAGAGGSNTVGAGTGSFGGTVPDERLSPDADLPDSEGMQSSFGTIAPEPSSMMLLFSGLAGLLLRRRRS